MGTEETDTPTKAPKPSSTQDQPPPSSPATVYPDWTSFQAYYNSAGTPPIAPPAFFHSSMASSPQAHPYMWGQHMMPPYGTPPPYVTMYPHGGLYAHPSMPPGSHPYSPYPMISSNGTGEASLAGTGGREADSKSGEGKKKTILKRSKGSLGSLNMLTSKENEMGKTSGAHNGGISQSGESVGEGSSEGSHTNSQNNSQHSEKASADAEGQNGDTTCSVSSGATQTPSSQAMANPSMVLTVPPNNVSGPTTNLNIGMDYWGPTPAATHRAKLPTISAGGGKVPSSLGKSHDGVPSDLWMQDERELKRQRRKQSNRESARRSRLRKQAEYDELALRVDALKGENNSLKEELDHIREECEQLASENVHLTESLKNHEGLRGNGGEDQAECTSQLTTNNDSIER